MVTANFTENETKNVGIAKMDHGLYIFHFSIPANDYTVINRVKAGVTWSGTPGQLYESLLKKVKKENLKCDGVIINDEMTECEMFIYKE